MGASLPLGSINTGNLQSTSTQISFDPLALLAVLHNPRAAASAARLYKQHNLPVFRWPHTMMIGGALPPFKLLIDHLVSQRHSIHPAVEMSKADTDRLEVHSNISDGAFSELPITYSNLWLSDLLSFRPSSYPLNDILIVHVDNIHGERVRQASAIHDGHHPVAGDAGRAIASWFQRCLLMMVNAAAMTMLLAGCVMSLLLGDMWSTALFGVYTCHSIASLAVSSVRMVCSSDATTRGADGFRVHNDATVRYAVYQRPEGGKIIFKGRQDTLETWARMAWTFQRSTLNNIIHWSWMLTGSLSAAASVVCMVNMRGYLQLAYLGALVISSLLEIIVTVVARNIQCSAIHYGDTHIVNDNMKWSRGVIRAALETDERWSLQAMPWMEFGLFPDIPVFNNLCALLPRLRSQGTPMEKAAIINHLSVDAQNGQRGLTVRLADEICEAQQRRFEIRARLASTSKGFVVEK